MTSSDEGCMPAGCKKGEPTCEPCSIELVCDVNKSITMLFSVLADGEDKTELVWMGSLVSCDDVRIAQVSRAICKFLASAASISIVTALCICSCFVNPSQVAAAGFPVMVCVFVTHSSKEIED